MKIYLVQGDTGEHADKTAWPVCSHRTLEGAHVKKAMFETWARLHSVLNVDGDNIPQTRVRTAIEDWKKTWPDYAILIDYTGIMWDVIETEYDPDEQIPGSGAA